MQAIKDELPSALISGIIGIAVEKFILKHDISSNDKIFGIVMPKYGSTLLTIGAGSIIGKTLSGYGNQWLGSYSKPVIGGAFVSGVDYLNGNKNMINMFLEGAGSIYLGQTVYDKIPKKKDNK